MCSPSPLTVLEEARQLLVALRDLEAGLPFRMLLLERCRLLPPSCCTLMVVVRVPNFGHRHLLIVQLWPLGASKPNVAVTIPLSGRWEAMDDGPRELLDKAQHYRRIATLVSDEQVAQALLDL